MRASTFPHTSGINDVCICSQQACVYGGCDDGTICCWNVESGALELSLTVDDSEEVTCVTLNSDSSLLAAGLSNGCICLYRVQWSGADQILEPMTTFVASDDEINRLSFQHKNAFLAAVDDNGYLIIYDMLKERVSRVLKSGHENVAAAVQCRPAGPWDVVTGGLDATAVRWDVSRGRPINRVQFTVDTAEEAAGAQSFNPPFVHDISFDSRGRYYACGLGDSTIAIVDFRSGAVVSRVSGGHRAAVNGVTFCSLRGMASTNDKPASQSTATDSVLGASSASPADTPPPTAEGDAAEVKGRDKAAAPSTSTLSKSQKKRLKQKQREVAKAASALSAPDGLTDQLVSSGNDGKLKLWTLAEDQTWRTVAEIELPENANAVAASTVLNRTVLAVATPSAGLLLIGPET